jgi:4-hydroxy-4-methyl-2-oxoglutarate aldolase
MPWGCPTSVSTWASSRSIAADARVDWEYDNDEVKRLTFFRRMYRGCVVVVSSAGENRAGHWGELMSLSAQSRGAAGVIVDGGIRDGSSLIEMQDWPVFTRYLSPIDARGRTRIRAIEEPIAVAGSLTSQVRIVPGDWIFGDMDGVVVIPAKNVEEVVRRAEDMGGVESRAREEIRNGADDHGIREIRRDLSALFAFRPIAARPRT